MSENPPVVNEPLNGKKFEGDGMFFKGKLIGMEDLSVDRNEKVCLDSMFKLKAVVKARGEHKQRIQMQLATNGVKIIDEITKVEKFFVCSFQGIFSCMLIRHKWHRMKLKEYHLWWSIHEIIEPLGIFLILLMIDINSGRLKRKKQQL